MNQNTTVNLTNPNTNDIPIKKKRGRPRKNKTVHNVVATENKVVEQKNTNDTKNNQKNNKSKDEEIILHLPINMGDIDKLCSKKNTFTETENASDTINNHDVFEKVDNHKTSSSSIQDTNIFTIADMSYDNSSYESSDNEEIFDLKNKIKEQEDTISKLEGKVKECNKIINDKIYSGILDKNIVEMDIKFMDIKDGKQISTDKTDIACWWCTYNFDTMPCFIPEKYCDNTYYTFGCFCSFNCAVAYNVNIDDYKVWERYSLMKKLYNIICDNNNDINIAPPKETLDKFGGPLSIDDYRKNSKYLDKEYRIIMPPMVSIAPMVEQNYKDNYNVSKVKFTDPNQDLVLKRSKPLPNTKNTLLDTMGIFTKQNKKR